MQFVNPLIILGLVAILIPIAVHLFNFRKYRKLYFSNVLFLKELKQQTRKQSNLLQRLVLLFRILTFVFIVLAFAQPFVSAKIEKVDFKSKIISVFVDNSFSMEAASTRGTLLDEAKIKASEIAAAYAQDDQFQLLTNDFEGKHQRLVSRDEFLLMLNEVKYSSASRSLSEIIARQSDLLASSRKSKKFDYVISDFQKSTLMKSIPDSSIKDGYLIPLKPASTNNLYIDSCWFENPVLRINEQAILHVKVKNVSDIKLEKIPVKLMIEDAQRSVASVDVNAGSSQEISFTFSNSKAGNLSGYIEISDYPVTYDDIYYFTYKISPVIPVLCINAEATDPYINSVFKVDSILRLTNTTTHQIDFSSLSTQRLIILDKLTTFSSGLIQELSKFVQNGGSVVIFPSLDVPVDAINPLLSRLGTDLFTDIDLSKIKIAKINTLHPLFREVFDQSGLKADNLDLPVINKHFNILQSSASTSETLLELANRQPFLVESSNGKGKVYLFTAPLTDEAGNFPRHALFVPTMLNMAFLSEKTHPLMYYSDYTGPIEISGNYSKGDQVLNLKEIKGGYDFIPEFRQTNGQNFIFTNNQVPAAGIYKAMSDDRIIDLIAFNYNRKESDLAVASSEEIEQAESKTGFQTIEDSPKPLDKIINKKGHGDSLWKWFIVAALCCLACETLLLAFFRKNRTPI